MFHVKQEDLIIGIDPGIKRQSYTLDYLLKEFEQEEWVSFVDRDKSNKCHIDIPGINREMLINKGVSRETIEVSPIDTANSERFFSHYRDSRLGVREGFFTALACLK
ncbi:MAG: laccase domain-containing protein [bacterium]|nr:laccase domain-containing protein [bacterium]